MCRIVPSSGQPEYLLTSEGKKTTRTKKNTAPVRKPNGGASNHATHASCGHSRKAITTGTTTHKTPTSEHSRRLSPKSQLSFSPHHWQGKVPQRTLMCLPQHGHLSKLDLLGWRTAEHRAGRFLIPERRPASVCAMVTCGRPQGSPLQEPQYFRSTPTTFP